MSTFVVVVRVVERSLKWKLVKETGMCERESCGSVIKWSVWGERSWDDVDVVLRAFV